ncbi:MAG TPA: type 3 dihydrofolate reductase [Bacteroidetes bacterium]|nr:type 3 dihydrofolate reductase [Bacteroidota bacterium]
MTISIIVAMAANRVIGKNNALPWRLPADLRFFKATTMGKPIIMGRKTYESIGRPLPGRLNIVLSRNPDFRAGAGGCTVVPSLQDALDTARDSGAEEAFIIGGATLYAEALAHADRLYITFIDEAIDGDVFFPDIDFSHWQEISREDHLPDDENPHSYSFAQFARKMP